jgi:excisionase family DNA binding protein
MSTVKETAAYLGCSDMHVYRLIAAGELRPVDIAGPAAKRPKIRIRSDDLAGYIDRKTSGRAGHTAKQPA